jgi:PmbA protein
MNDYRSLASEVVAELKRQGADAADVYIVTSSTFNTDVRLGRIEKLEQSIAKGMGLRIFKGNATATTFTTDFADKSVKKLASETLDIVRVSSPDQYNGLAPKEALGIHDGALMIFDEALAAIPTDKKIDMAREIEAIGMKYDKRINNSDGSGWFDSTSQVTLANSDGFVGQYKTTAVSTSVSLIAEENGVKQTDYWYSFNRYANKLAPAREVGEMAARRVIGKLGARKPKTQQVPVVVDPLMGARFVGMIFGSASGRSIYRKSSFLVDKLGQQIASPLVTLVDDATMTDGPSSRPFDGEGVRASQVTLLDKGMLKTYVCDAYAARRLNMKVTGNASRSWQSPPFVGSTNLFIKAGESDPKEIVRSVKNGLYLNGLIGQGFNGVTGDLSFGAFGFWIENGELAYPVQELTLAGNALDMLKNISMVGNDLTFKLGGSAAPTFLISEATIGGA